VPGTVGPFGVHRRFNLPQQDSAAIAASRHWPAVGQPVLTVDAQQLDRARHEDLEGAGSVLQVQAAMPIGWTHPLTAQGGKQDDKQDVVVCSGFTQAA